MQLQREINVVSDRKTNVKIPSEGFSSQLKIEIEDFFTDLKKSHPFFNRLYDGKIQAPQIAKVLAGTRYLLTQTPVHLELALQGAREMEEEFPGIVAYFEHHIAEEVGHDQWATEDLKRLADSTPSGQVSTIVPEAMFHLVQYVRDIVSTDPVLFIPYILFAEYMAVIAVPHTVENLERYCGIPPEMMTVFTRHAELDVDHAEEDCEIIDSILKKAPSYKFPLRSVIHRSLGLYSAFLREVAE